ncbi:hypothetical protein PENPOL_c001G09517 [Penicillium polonicum]|uniref:Uncharacterized protein n=1 Tax=Penicillium polonicum TaxID=60169 RepID=A0A1V6P1G0_PENPO|nr:hypothetical protein PENPOL_c001G09517 [Penicillium polonicum]
MKLLQTLETCLQHSPALFSRRTISSHRLGGRAYSGSRSWRLPNPPPSNSPASPAASASASSSTGGLLARSGIGKSLGAYSQIQAKRPYTTQICTTIVVWLCGDLGAQFLFSSNDVKDEEIKSSTQRGEIQKNLPSSHYDPWRTARHLTVGIVASIPSYEWFMFLHRRFNFASSIASLATKVVVQQAVFTPVFNTYFFTIQSLLSGASVEDTLVRLQLALPTSIANGVKVWTGVAIISFMYVPPQFRSVFSGCIAVAWQTYLSWMNQNVRRSAH